VDEQELGGGGAPGAFERRVPIRWRDMDAFGHVNNAVYLTYIEEAHDEFLAGTVGDGDGESHVVMARVEMDFLAPLTQDDDHVVVSCRLESLGNSSIRTVEEIVAADGRRAARSRSVMVKVERGSGRSLPLSPTEREALSAP
jgi:acyl-CoA thioester hydrolase